MPKPRKWKLENLPEAVSRSRNFSEVSRYMGLSGGGSHSSSKKWCEKLDLDTSHFESKTALAQRTIVRAARRAQAPLEERMVENSSYPRSSLRRRLLAENKLEEECSECGQKPVWRGKRLPMVLDHINGVNNDHRFENLRFLCPNCSFTLDTYGTRNWKNLRSRVA